MYLLYVTSNQQQNSHSDKMKIDNIIKKALIARGVISEAAGDPTTPEEGRQTKSFDLNNPQQVLNAAQQYNCWQQWGLKSKPEDRVFTQEYPFSYRGKILNVKNNESYLVSGSLVFLGRKAEGEVDTDDTWFMGFNSSEKVSGSTETGGKTQAFKGFRWRCKQLKTLEQAGTGSLSQAQQQRLDQYLATDGSVYTKVGGAGMEAKDVSTLTFKSGKPVFDEAVGIPPKGNFVYIQTGLENKNINQLAELEKFLGTKGWSLTVPPISDPKFKRGKSLLSMYPEAGQFGLTSDVIAYPSQATYTPQVTTKSGKSKTDKASCTTAIYYLTKCMRNPRSGADCDDVQKREENKDTAANCYLELQKIKKNPNPNNRTKLLGGIFGPEDELETLTNAGNNIFGIRDTLQKIKGSYSTQPKAATNESKKIDLRIRKHLIEGIRRKNSQI